METKHSEIERNHCLAIILLCLQYLQKFSFVQSGMAHGTWCNSILYMFDFNLSLLEIAQISVHIKIEIDNREMCLTSSDADFQFKKMALLALCLSVNNFSAISVILQMQPVMYKVRLKF